MKTPRGTARALRRASAAPSLRIAATEPDRPDEDDAWERAYQAELLARYRDYRDEGYSHYQAMLMSGRGDPDSLGCS